MNKMELLFDSIPSLTYMLEHWDKVKMSTLFPKAYYLNYSTQVIILALLFALTSITTWTLVGKFLRKFATNEKFIKYFNYAMSLLLLLSIITFYL